MSETKKSQSPRRRSRSRSRGRDNKPIRVWCPGSYDFLHYEQANFLRRVQREMSTRFPNVHIVAGVYSDDDLISAGRKPVFSVEERCLMLKANKWVNDIVQNAPMELSKKVLKDHSCDYSFFMGQNENLDLESDELSKNDLIECGLLKRIIPSKHGACITSSDIINRILLVEPRDANNNTRSGRNWRPQNVTFPYSISCKELLGFSTGNIPKSTDKVVYVDGSFDVFHSGHVRLLEKASALGDFLYVGLHSDNSISNYAGVGFPIMQWNERVMALLACKYVSEIILDAPVDLSESLFNALSVNYVVPSIDDYESGSDRFVHKKQCDDGENLINDRYWVAKKRGIFHEIQVDQGHVTDVDSSSTATVTTREIISRVHKNWQVYSYAGELNSGSADDNQASQNVTKDSESVTPVPVVQNGFEGDRACSLESKGDGETLLTFQ